MIIFYPAKIDLMVAQFNLSSLFPSSHSRCVHGLCVPKGQSYSCKCSEGYQGQYCDRRQEPPACRGQRCGHGECRVSEAGEPICHCQPGYTGPTCDTGKMENIGRGDGKQIWQISVHIMCVFYVLSPLMSSAHMSRRDGEGAAEASPPDENMHVHQQDSPHGLSPILPGSSTSRCLLWRHQEQEEEGGFPLQRRHLVLRGDGNCSGMWLLQVPVVTAPQFVSLFCNTHRCHFVNSTRQWGCRSEIFPRWWAPPLCDFVFLHIQFDRRQFVAKRNHKRKQKWDMCACFLTERKYIVRYKWERHRTYFYYGFFFLKDDKRTDKLFF